MDTIRDMLYVKAVERRLRRLLTEDEMNGESVSINFPDGHSEYIQVPLLAFPDDLLSKPEDMFQSEINSLRHAA